MKIINDVPPAAKRGELVAMDTEFYGQEKGRLHRPHGTFAALSVCLDGRNVYQIYDSGQIGSVLSACAKGTWVFHNALYDLIQLRRFVKINPRYIHDTMLVDQSMFGGYYQTFSLQDLVRRWLNENLEKDVRSEFATASAMTAEMMKYAAKDALQTYCIARKQLDEFGDMPAFKAYTHIDEPMIFPTLDMPGVPVDVGAWKAMAVSFAEKAGDMEAALGINTFSGPQVMRAAAGHGVHIRDTQAGTLLAYKDVPFIASVIECRMYRKAVSTYGEKWLEKHVEPDGRVYASYHIVGTETGRFSCSNPNMQQIPARRIPEYRKVFPASPGHVLLVADVNQQEPRILAWESKDEQLLAAFASGEDLHLYVARAVFNDPKMKGDDPRRNVGKIINLGTSYGLSEFGLATRLNITEEEALQFLRKYFARFAGVFSWIGAKRREAFTRGYVTTVSGRRLYINPYNKQWQNNAINAPIQGGAADFTKTWDRNIWEECRRHKAPYLVDRRVHDELVLNVPKADAALYENIISAAFATTAEKLFPGIPFKYDVEKGRSWAVKQDATEAEDE